VTVFHVTYKPKPKNQLRTRTYHVLRNT